MDSMKEMKKDLDARIQEWSRYEEFRESLDELSELEVVNRCVEVLDNTLTFLLTSKVVKHQWNGIMGEEGLLDTLEKKTRMAMGLGLLANHHVRLLKQMGEIHDAFQAFEGETKGFEEEPVPSIANQFVLPEDTYLPLKSVDGGRTEITIRWNPLELAKSTRGQFMYVFEYLYFDLANRSAFFETESPETVEEVSLSMVLDKHEERYVDFISDLDEQIAKAGIELKIALNLAEFFMKLDAEILPPLEWEVLKKKRDANQKEENRLQWEVERLNDLRQQTMESWENYKKNFDTILEAVRNIPKTKVERKMEENGVR